MSAKGPSRTLRNSSWSRATRRLLSRSIWIAARKTIISLAYFDLDLYEPTKAVLKMIQPFLTRGSVIAFDELGSEHFPGETAALREVVALDKVRLVHTPYSSHRAYFIYE